jgi:hypothetical protein
MTVCTVGYLLLKSKLSVLWHNPICHSVQRKAMTRLPMALWGIDSARLPAP